MGEIINFNKKRNKYTIDDIKYDKNLFFEVNDDKKYSYDFITKIFENFSDDYIFLDLVLDELCSNCTEEWILEFRIKLYKIVKRKLTSEINNGKLKRYCNALQYQIELEIYDYMTQIDASIEDDDNELDMGFYFVEENFSYSTDIKNHFAEIFIDKIISNYNLEKYIHNNYNKFSDIKREGITTFIIKFISLYDRFLSNYIINHQEVLMDIKATLKNIEDNWDLYENQDKELLFAKKIKKISN